ncbi:MAG: DUF1905 domain-containing protein [Rhodococcus sp.]|nr:DUF1905 domain-containing protein [Rhodococcus sp. (in: high G+C Gram-positive bacteria)]
MRFSSHVVGAYWLPLSAENRTAAGVVAGEDVEVELELDSDPRTVDVPDDLVTALGKNASAAAAFEALSYSNKRRHVLSVEGAKTEATRIRRITKVVDSLSAAES